MFVMITKNFCENLTKVEFFFKIQIAKIKRKFDENC